MSNALTPTRPTENSMSSQDPLPGGAPAVRPGRPLATWPLSPVRAWTAAAGLAVGGVVLTAAGSAMGQVLKLAEIPAVYLLAAVIALSALVGLVIMGRSRPAIADYGFRRPENLRAIAWALPVFALPVVVWLTTPPTLSTSAMPAFALLTVAVGFNEEIWFRGLVPAALRRLGQRTAILGAAVLFGVLHLANAAAIQDPLYLALQVVLAFLVGWVFGEIVALTGSLWPGIAWHAVYDFSAYIGGDALTTAGLAGIAVIDLVLLGYGLWLWQRIPATR